MPRKGKVSAYHKCFAKKMKGRTFRTKTAHKKALKAAIRSCKRTHGKKKPKKRKK